MTITQILMLVALMIFSVVLADYLTRPDFDDDTPIVLDILDKRPVTEDFGKYLNRLPEDKRQVLTGYLERVDNDELREGEKDYNTQAVTPAEVFKAHSSTQLPKTP